MVCNSLPKRSSRISPSGELIGRGKRHGLQRRAITVDPGRGQAAHGKRHLRLRPVRPAYGCRRRAARCWANRRCSRHCPARPRFRTRTATSPPRSPCSCRTSFRNRRRPSLRRTTACLSDHACPLHQLPPPDAARPGSHLPACAGWGDSRLSAAPTSSHHRRPGRAMRAAGSPRTAR